MVSGSLRATDSLLATTGIFDQSITITSQEAIPHLIFSRDHNYICFPSGGSFRITAGTTVNAKKYCPLIIEGTVDSNGITTATNVYPGVSNKANLGLSDYKWANVYATTFTGDLSGNATTATTWQTSRTLTIGNKGQSVNGGSDVSWALNDILYNATTIGTDTSWDQLGPSLYYVASSTAFTGTNHPGNNNEQAPYTWGQLIVARAGNGGILQVYAPHTGSSGEVNAGLRYRTGWNNTGWKTWSTLLDDRLWRKYIFANKNIGRSTLTVTDSSWAVTSGTDVFGLAFKDTGLTYTPSGGSATASSDTGDWRAWLTCAANGNTVTLNMRIDGTWEASKFIGPLDGNAATATKLKDNASNTTASFWRGDNTWSSTLGGSITISKAAECGMEVVNSQTTNPHSGLFGVGTSGNLGIYDRTKSKWVVYSDTSGNVALNGNAATATKATQDGSGNTITSTYLKLAGGTMTGELYYNTGTATTNREVYRAYNNSDTGAWWFILRNNTPGTASAEGFTELLVGNGKKSNVAWNASGKICMYNSNGGGCWILGKYGAINGTNRDYINIAYISCTQIAGTLIGGCTGNAATATTASACSGNAATASKMGEAASWLYFHHSNEVNFGGTYNSNANIYFGYRATDSRAKPTDYYFGSDNGTASVHCNRLFAVSATDAAGNAANAVALVVGGIQTSAHIEMDSNEIIAKSNGTTKVSLWFNDSAEVTADGKVKNAVWNDYAEYRQTDIIDPGYCVATQEDGTMHITNSHMHPGARIVSDTFGHAIGMSDTAKTPIAVAGRVLVYPYQNRNNYHIGDCVCATYDGKVDIMTREEIKEYPDRIIGIVDEIPSYEYWEQSYTFYKTKEKIKSQIKVNGRIWIYVK